MAGSPVIDLSRLDGRLNLAGWVPRSGVNGPGERFVIWTQGCPLHCPGCANPETWPFETRRLEHPLELAEHVLSTPGIEGLTVSGGEPFAQATALAPLLAAVRQKGISVFVFTGLEWAEIGDAPLIPLVDVLVTGRFLHHLEAVPWRGSANQQVHFLTDRYGPGDMPDGLAPAEVHIAADGTITWTGFPGDALLGDLKGGP